MDPDAIWNSVGSLSPDAPTNHLTEGERALHTTYWVDALSGNGGFLNSFASVSTIINRAPSAYERLGLPEAAALIRQGLALFPEGRLPNNADEAATLVDELPEADRLEELGNRYDDAVPDLHAAFLSYLREHPDEFSGPLGPPTNRLSSNLIHYDRW